MSHQIVDKLATTSARLLAMAISLVGTTQTVREHMEFSEADLAAVLAGERELTWVELDLLTTLLMAEQGELIARNRELVELVRLRIARRG